MADPARIAVGGENLIDHVTRDGAVSAHPGGSPFNVALALGRLGAPVAYVSPISTDRWGAMLADVLMQAGVALTGGRCDAPTTMSRVRVVEGSPDYRFERSGTAERQVTRDGLIAALPEGAGAIHTGSLTLTDGPDAEIWESVCAECARRGMAVSLDPNVRLSVIADPDGYRARILRMAGTADLLKLSDEDLSGLFPGMAEAGAIARLRAAAPGALLVLTRGADGASAWCGADRLDVPAPRVDTLADTVGAGDTFTAALLDGLNAAGALAPGAPGRLARDALAPLLARAAAAAALTCTREGCDPPSRAELDAALTKDTAP